VLEEEVEEEDGLQDESLNYKMMDISSSNQKENTQHQHPNIYVSTHSQSHSQPL
jgi:hypothetical protein